MKKIVGTMIAIGAITALTACGLMDRTIAHYTGYSKMCVDGVSYLQFTSGATAQVDRSGKVVSC